MALSVQEKVTSEIMDILPLYDLQQRKVEEQIRHIEAYRRNFTNKEITDYWGKKPAYMYTLMKKLGMPTNSRTRKPRKEKPVKQVSIPAPAIQEITESQVIVQKVEVEPEVDGFAFNINGTYSSEKLIKRLEKISLLLMDEETDFEIKLSIKETK